jgi:zinc/manganese transport system substrate-binding protein
MPTRGPQAAATRSERIVVLLAILVLLAIALGLGGCASGLATGGVSGTHVVAAENMWGSIAAQLAGTDAGVQSIISSPAQDPHSYEPTATDARVLAGAQLVIVNGVGYDPWVARLLAANPVPERIVLDVGGLLALPTGTNPHQWYDPSSVEAVANAITADLTRLNPRQAGYLQHLRKRFETIALAQYHRLIGTIRERYGGTPVGASESIFASLAPALRLKLLTPDTFMKAISEGTDVTAQDALSTERQITGHQIKVWIYNSQNTTPDVKRLTALARARGIPVVTITETLTPPSASFQQWQDAQLEQLKAALHEATGR